MVPIYQVLLDFILFRNLSWPSWPLIGRHIIGLISSIAPEISSKLGTNHPYGIPTKCCYFWRSSEMQYGRPGLWLVDTISTSVQEQLQISTPKLGTNISYGFPTKCCYFLSGSEKQNGLPGLWLADNFYSRTAAGIYSKIRTNIFMESRRSIPTFLVDPKSNMIALSSAWLTNFQLLMNGFKDLLQT